MSEKRFWINKSRLVNDGWVIDDLKREFTFPVVVGDKTALYSYCKALNKLFNENEQLKKQLDDNLQFLIRASERLGFESLDHLLYTLDKGEITGYSTANWER